MHLGLLKVSNIGKPLF